MCDGKDDTSNNISYMRTLILKTTNYRAVYNLLSIAIFGHRICLLQMY